MVRRTPLSGLLALALVEALEEGDRSVSRASPPPRRCGPAPGQPHATSRCTGPRAAPRGC
eukprot:5820713-Alexandrium_andersonii.AAC.1